jgi:hypothetical protein
MAAMRTNQERWWLTEDTHHILINTEPERLYDLISDRPSLG